MSRLTELLRAAKQLDPQLGEDLEAEIQPLQKRLPFGLNFERHAPEAVELAGHRIRKGSKVRVLPPRGSTERGDQRIWIVEAVHGESADISTPGGTDVETATGSLDDLILVAEFRDRIYPGLRFDGSVECGRDRPFHSIINGENFHVLEQLTFTHEHSVDAIYIDPPYNTGARDWKYNNDYVEGDDLYRHSKWLAFMERRLRLAKRLLKPDDSVLIITIDEKECARLGLLLEQVFPEASIQMVTSVINPSGSSRSSGFSRADEYIYFVMFGVSDAVSWTSDMLRQDATKRPVRWDGLMRTGGGSDRADRPGLFYPIFFHEDSGTFHSVGDPIPAGSERGNVAVPLGTFPVWPLTGNRERRWRVGPTKARELASKGYLRFGPWQPGSRSRTIYYLPSGSAGRVDSGELSILSRDRDGSVVLSDEVRSLRPMSVWNMKSHSAAEWGTGTVRSLLPERQFPYPKSLYAVEDALRFFVADKPHSVVLDFFAGSGTTAHAIMRLNRQDKGSRQCISVTNNEVSADDQTKP